MSYLEIPVQITLIICATIVILAVVGTFSKKK